MNILFPSGGEEFSIEEVTEYQFSEEGEWMYAVSINEDSVNYSKIHLFDTEKKELTVLWEGEGVIKKVVDDEKADQMVFLPMPRKRDQNSLLKKGKAMML